MKQNKRPSISQIVYLYRVNKNKKAFIRSSVLDPEFLYRVRKKNVGMSAQQAELKFQGFQLKKPNKKTLVS